MQDINQFLNPALLQKSSEWQTVKDALILALPPEVLKQVVYATIKDTTLTIFCATPAWTAKMRFYDSDIKKIFTEQGMVLRMVQAKSMPPVAPRA